MQKDISSPEEKLLSIIKGKRVGPSDAGIEASGAKKPEPQAPDIRDTIDSYLSTILKSNFFRHSAFDSQKLKVFNKYMVIAIAIAASYFILDILFINPYKKAVITIATASSSVAAAALPSRGVMPIETDNYSHYANKITGKDIFGAGPAASQDDSRDSVVGDDNVGLVGIISGDNPQAIIEDKKSQKTYYLTKGQSVNGITVESIDEGKVLLDINGRKITLLL